MDKDTIDVVLAIVQIATLIALIIYVAKTWEMASASKKSAEVSEETLKEMRESRDQEIAPYVVVYFDIPYGKSWIYLVVRNIGKSVANDVKMEFQPPLRNSDGDQINNMPLIRGGVGSIPPGYELKTLFDTTVSYFNSGLPLTYKVKVFYSGGLRSDIRVIEQTIDLSAFKGRMYITEKGMDDVAKGVGELAKQSRNIAQQLEEVVDRLSGGIWLKNSDFLIAGLQLQPEVWRSILRAKLIEFKMLWTSVYGGEDRKLVGSFLTDLRSKSIIMGAQILTLASNAPANLPSELVDRLVEIAVKLSELGRARFYGDGDKSISDFNTAGAKIIDLVDQAIEQIELFDASARVHPKAGE